MYTHYAYLTLSLNAAVLLHSAKGGAVETGCSDLYGIRC